MFRTHESRTFRVGVLGATLALVACSPQQKPSERAGETINTRAAAPEPRVVVPGKLAFVYPPTIAPSDGTLRQVWPVRDQPWPVPATLEITVDTCDGGNALVLVYGSVPGCSRMVVPSRTPTTIEVPAHGSVLLACPPGTGNCNYVITAR